MPPGATFFCSACGRERPKIKDVQPIWVRARALVSEPGGRLRYTRDRICQPCWVRHTFGDAAAAALDKSGE
jgi:hypothetical protein